MGRVFIETRERRGKPQYRWVAERKFVRWQVHRKGFWTRSLAKATARGQSYLNSKRRDQHEEVGYV